MAPTITSALSEFITALTNVAAGLVNSLLAVFGAILALGTNTAKAVLQFAQSVLKLGTDLCQGVVGFVAANFFVLVVLGGVYYWYTNQNQRRGKVKSR
ncbi:hypothetical protein E1B28_001319 [Marasmius oreades]|uniref:Uncharacterized protein n=1 Tax=Marasmius oreades TaxID=181124 RepID=A0A9P7V373_9AGAR|nr:uncharacterized protein E1B28_001319 [Marasmius oreades]KAG7099470.1 hypothetical protein E1B28_001319 [Marasmius oreades]